MNNNHLSTFIGLIIPFVGTLLGSACVFLLKDNIHEKIKRFLLGFAAGVMVAAAVWSLIIPSMQMSKENNQNVIIPAVGGIALGMLLLLFLDKVIPHLHTKDDKPEGPPSKLANTTMLFLAVTLHNIPEGMTVGVIWAALLSSGTQISLAAALALSIGIAIQNFPEGAIISMPMKNEGYSKFKAFLFGTASGIVEPIAAFLTILLSKLVVPILPWFLTFAAGAMLYVVVEELIPEASEGEHSNIGTLGFGLGFIIMLILDVTLA